MMLFVPGLLMKVIDVNSAVPFTIVTSVFPITLAPLELDYEFIVNTDVESVVIVWP